MATIAPAEFDVSELLAHLPARTDRITADSRRVRAGDAFAAFPGQRADGREFIAEAIERGAGAVLWEAQGFHWNPAWHVPNLAVADLRSHLGAIADVVFGQPSAALWVIGVTGTNGKTSCSQWAAQCLDACGRRAGVLGTLGNGLVGALSPADHTTADAARVHELFAEMKAAGAQAVAMEVSSHGLDQGRVGAVRFDVALFTNLTRDHLDYHGTMAAYGAAKAKLFAWPELACAVLNVDDPFGQSLVETVRARGTSVLTYGLGSADITATTMHANGDGIALSVATPWGNGEVRTRLIGTFNAANLLGVLGTLLASDVALDDALAALARVEAPPGRMQRLGGGYEPLVVIDYAHSPDALEQVLIALRSAVVEAGQLCCVFGCGGDRDVGKRPEMGRIAARLADRVVVTNDNPRTENPEAIAAAIVRGIRDAGTAQFDVELDRTAAIAMALATAHAGDVVLIAGKGHEEYQETHGVRVHYSDAEAAVEALAAWRSA
jgi:UDP-N-acetylmuramoyl-L-alanyl-D-glutamate--2,6-diaminopimelate ligase